MSKKRPGVEASKRLSEVSDCKVWEQVESQFAPLLSLALKEEIRDCNKEYDNLKAKFSADSSKDCISKEELMAIVRWKFSVGKKRPALMKHLNSNTDKFVKQCSENAIAHARSIEASDAWSDDDIKCCINHLTELSGVGPATASAIVSMIRPDVFPYMYDECIDTFLPRRTYTLPVYLEVAKACTQLANELNGWTTARVARVLWVAARVCASNEGMKDYTLNKSKTLKEETNTPGSRSNKRRRKS
ncbi:unnamed protein product [Cylindrotheca closterium]|uniref:Uncharacterized protein n=1 Tax=Cylindrotheca closterium TaxID=2856 RepID=A0AAD2JJ10_9STRA|nr:unnamed protein product [Cylindrotheca closterium]